MISLAWIRTAAKMLYNKRDGRKIVSNVRICKSALCQTIGLMFSRSINDQALMFEFPREIKLGLHMWFVFYPIDVVFLDSEKRVVELKEDFKPFTVYRPKNKSKYVIELPAGTISKADIALGDILLTKDLK
jgi:hypothetical protein